MATTIHTPKAAAFRSLEKSNAAVDFAEIQPSALLRPNRTGGNHRSIGGVITTRESYDTTATRMPSTFNKGR
jgi:hypothetical protein